MSHLCPTCVREWRGCRCPRPDDQKPIKSPSKDAGELTDELTVDDVLALLGEAVGARGLYLRSLVVHEERPGFFFGADMRLARDPVGFTGTLREVLTEPKRRWRRVLGAR